MPARVDELRSLLVGREGVRQRRVFGLAVAIGGTLGLLLVGHQVDPFAAPGWVALGLFGVGVSVPAALNGHRRGGVLVSWVASAIGALPLALAFAPSGPVTMPLNAILVKAAWWTAVLALVLGSVFHGVGMMHRWVGVTRD